MNTEISDNSSMSIDDEVYEEINQYMSKNKRLKGIGISDDEDDERNAGNNNSATFADRSDWGTKKSAYYVNDSEKKKKMHSKESEIDAHIELEEAKTLKRNTHGFLTKDDYQFGDMQSDSTEDSEAEQSNPDIESQKSSIETLKTNNIKNDENFRIYLEKYLEVYEKLTDEVDEILNPVQKFCTANPGSITPEFSSYVNYKIFFNSLYALNINLALQFESQKALEEHQIFEQLKKFDKIFRELKHHETRKSNYKNLIHQMISCINKGQSFSLQKEISDVDSENKIETNSSKESYIKHRGSNRKSKSKNPRVLKKQKLIKKASKWQTVVPKIRKQGRDYKGEDYGIRKNALRSTKLS
ncbi:MAG: hypothetical protein MHMPM18_004545 [Marteilia pararefringens]